MNTAVIIQARMGSTRLPGKVMLPIAGAPLLQRMVERVQAAATPSSLVVATTTAPQDDAVRELCARMRVPCFSGHATNLLDRHLEAARSVQAEWVVKIPSDCPLVDPAVIDRVIGFALAHAGEYDYVSNLHPPTYPDGNDVEVVPFPLLETAWREATRNYEREHTTPFFWEHPDRFRIANVAWETGEDLSMTHRWTIDYPEDYDFVRTVYNELWSSDHPVFTMQEILQLLEQKREVQNINAHLAGVNWYRHHLGELTTITPDMTRSPGVEKDKA